MAWSEAKKTAKRALYRWRRERGLCVKCGDPCDGAYCALHKLCNARDGAASRRRRGIPPTTGHCTLCDDVGHFRPTCPAEPTR